MKKERSPYWITRAEICEIMMCGTTLASRYLKQVNQSLEKRGLFVPQRGLTSRKEFMRYFNLEGN